MKTKKVYLEPEIKIVEVKISTALMAGSGTDAGLNPGGNTWGDEIEDI